MSVTFAELAALAISTDDLPPMREVKRKTHKTDRTRTTAAKRATLARRHAMTVKRESVAA